MSIKKDDVVEVIEILQGLEEYEQIQNEMLESISEIVQSQRSFEIMSESESDMFSGYEELLFLQSEKAIELVEISKWSFGLSVLNVVLLIVIIFSVFFSKLEA